MSDVPATVPPGDDDFDYDNYENDYISGEWSVALQWAKDGDFKPLAECLRRDEFPLNNQDVRLWLANGLVDGFKKPRKVRIRPELALFEMASGRQFYVQKRHLSKHQLIKQVHLLRDDIGEENAVEKVAAENKMEFDTLRNLVQRTRDFWGLHPERLDGIFDDVVRPLNSDPKQPR